MFQEVRRTVLTIGLIAGTDRHPESDGGRTLPGHCLGEDADAAGQDRTSYDGTALGTVDEVAAGKCLLQRQGYDSH
jgi:hypothetical protein